MFPAYDPADAAYDAADAAYHAYLSRGGTMPMTDWRIARERLTRVREAMTGCDRGGAELDGLMEAKRELMRKLLID